MARDYYEVLGVERTIDAPGLKAAYRKLAMIHHPDRNGGSEESMAQFKEVSEAYTVLSDPNKRAAYDRFGHAGVNGGGGGNPFGQGQQGFSDINDIFSQVFGDAFGDAFGGRQGRGQQGGPRRGSDLRYDLEITLEQAYKGEDVELDIPATLTCDTCEGSGAKPGTKPVTCTTCQGAGRVRQANGFFQVERTCPRCHGQGQMIAGPVPDLPWSRSGAEDPHPEPEDSAGVDDGSRIRLSGEGDAGQCGGPRGDLYVFISVTPHDLFERDNLDLLVTVPVPMTVAALGGEIDAPCLVSSACDGKCKASVAVPAGAQTGKTVRIKGKGMPHLNGRNRGDLVVELFVETPTDLTARQRELLEELACRSGKGRTPQFQLRRKGEAFWADILGNQEADGSKENAA